MKNCILSAIAGALCMLLLFLIIPVLTDEPRTGPYEHTNFTSDLSRQDCYICGDDGFPFSGHWGEDNVGIVELNTFKVLYLPLNRYGLHGELIEEPAGFMQTSHLIDNDAQRYAHAYCFPDQAYAHAELTGVQYSIDRETIQNHLCQTCLDSINSLCFSGNPPAEFAIVNYEDRTIRPLLKSNTWFSTGNYGIDCEFKDNGAIDILVHYCPFRYSDNLLSNE